MKVRELVELLKNVDQEFEVVMLTVVDENSVAHEVDGIDLGLGTIRSSSDRSR